MLLLIKFGLFFLLLSLESKLLFASLLKLLSLLILVEFSFTDLSYHIQGSARLESIIAHETCDSLSHVIDLGHFNEHGDVVEQCSVIWVIVPRYNRQAALRLQHVRSWRVVDDDRILHITTDLGHILDEDAIDKSAVFSEESAQAVFLRIHHVHQWIRILNKANTRTDRDRAIMMKNKRDKNNTH